MKKLLNMPLRWQITASVAIGLFSIIAAAAIRAWLLPTLGTQLAFITFYPAVILCGVYAGFYAGLSATLFSTALILTWQPGGESFIQNSAEGLGVFFYVFICVLITMVCSALHRLNRLRAHAQTQADDAMREQHKSDERFLKAIENSPIGVALTSPAGKFMQINPALSRILGYSEEELKKLFIEDITHPEDIAKERQFVHDLMSNQSTSPEMEKRYVTKDGNVVWALVTGSVLRTEQGVPVQVIKQVQNITERKEMLAKLQYQAQYDFLTGLINRGYFLERAEQEFIRSVRYDHAISVAMLDIDHFKHINDNHGHHIGDELLKAFAKTCFATLREVDLIGRMGGDEFAILLPETSIDEAFEVLERLRSSLAGLELNLMDGHPFRITTSIGIASYGGSDKTLSLLLNRADKALYVAKASGRNKTHISMMH